MNLSLKRVKDCGGEACPILEEYHSVSTQILVGQGSLRKQG